MTSARFRRMLPVTFAMLACVHADDQFGNLTATSAGDTLFFSSATPLKRPTPHGAIFTYSLNNGLNTYTRPGLGDPFGFTTVEVGDNGVIATTLEQSGVRCTPFSAHPAMVPESQCTAFTILTSKLLVPGSSAVTLTGRLHLSRNGAYAALMSNFALTLFDVARGTSRELPPVTNAMGSAVGNEGTVVVGRIALDGDPKISMISNGSVRDFAGNADPIFDRAHAIPLSADGRRVAYMTGRTPEHRNDPRWRLHMLDLNTAEDRVIADRAIDGAPAVASLSNDGNTVAAFVPAGPDAPAELLVYEWNARRSRSFLRGAEQVTSLAISGNGKIVYAATATNRIDRIDVDSGAVAEVVPRTPDVAVREYRTVPGSYFKTDARGLCDHTATAPAPLPTTLCGVRIKLGDVYVPLVEVAPDYVGFQVPAGTPIGEWTLQPETDSPFMSRDASLDVRPWFMNFVSLPMHQDFSGPVTRDNPAAPGEYLHFFVTGLGPTDPPVPTGQPAPSAPPLAKVARALTAELQSQDSPADRIPLRVTFAGLLPGSFGIYQVDLQLPVEFSSAIVDRLSYCHVIFQSIDGSAGTSFECRGSEPTNH